MLCLACLATPFAAQQTPATPKAAQQAANPPATAKPGSAGAASAAKPSTPSTPAANAQTTAPKPQDTAAKSDAAKAQGAKPIAPPAAGANTGSSTSKPTSSTKPAVAATTASEGSAAKPTHSNPKPLTPSATRPRSGASVAKPAAPSEKGSGPNSVGIQPVSPRKPDVPSSATAPVIRPVAMRENIVRRDPFAPLIGKEISGSGSPLNLPPGKPGLLISSLRIDGIVSGPNGMIAIVSNAQDRVYFLREGDRLYDGQVEHITLDGISFHQAGKDPFGNSVEREVAKRLNSTPGEQQ